MYTIQSPLMTNDIMRCEDEIFESNDDGESNSKRVKLSLENHLEIAENIEENECFFGQRPFTKNQMRKWLKKEKWEARKNEKRSKEKAKAKQKRFEAKINNIDIGPSRKALKHCKVANSSCTSGVIIDLSFDNLMIEKDRAKVIKQILRCYSLNRRSPSPMNYYVCSFGSRTKKEMSRHNGYEFWDVKFEENSYLNIFPKDKLIYLSSESENVIEEVEPNKMYIIGGLVDHNAHKGLCHKIASEQGIQHGRLPIDKYLNMKSRKVLTIDHVFEILLRISEGKSWPETLMQVVPMRKGASVTSQRHVEDARDIAESDDTSICDNSTLLTAEQEEDMRDTPESDNTAACDDSTLLLAEHAENVRAESDVVTTCDNSKVQSKS